ncbi:MAG: alkaline phosphatase family protein [Tannerella sp.]|jgi:arylsulfatase A-like enzyme|nr:alkaline phosphatase family protein [Tannerella sp.]
MKKRIFPLIAALTVCQLQAQAQQNAPKLVVYITVDQLRGEYVEYFSHTFGEHGFKRLMNEGTVYHNLQFEFPSADQASAFATLFTGTNPCNHGITGNMYYDFDRLKEVSSLFDSEYLGNFTHDHYSPRNLLAATVADELKIASRGRSEVYAIAPDAESAILSSGHVANGVFWIDNLNGKWATTTYYKNVPWYVERYNNSPESLPVRTDAMTWRPSLPLEHYKALPYVQESVAFNHTFSSKTVDCYPKVKTSPFGNKEVNRLVALFFEYAGFGMRPDPDYMAITFYAGNYFGNRAKEYTYEIQDTYYQLDKDIEELLNLIDRKVGLKNTLVVFTGTGYFKSEEEPAEGMPGGEFHPKRCIALLNMYLMAIYGQKTWINGFYNNQIYLNHKVIEEAGLDLVEFQNKAADFVSEFSGVARVTTDITLRKGIWNEEMSGFHYGTYHTRRGDLIISLKPGWAVNNELPGEKVKLMRNNAVQTPLIFMGYGVKPQHIYREIKATEVAPTVTHLLRVRPPNACERTPLYEISVSK